MNDFIRVVKNEEIRTYIEEADKFLNAIGYTEHSFKHSTKCVLTVELILSKLGYDEDVIDCAKIAAYMHDIGNVINRADHAQSGAVMTFRLLEKLQLPAAKIAKIITAIGNHDEKTAYPISEVTAALILADKTDVRRTRVRNPYSNHMDIHDRVNYAVTKNNLELDMENRKLVLNLRIDTKVIQIFEYFEIFLSRMLLCKKAARFFDLEFKLVINGNELM